MEELVMFGLLLLAIVVLLILWIFISDYLDRIQDIDEMYNLEYKDMNVKKDTH